MTYEVLIAGGGNAARYAANAVSPNRLGQVKFTLKSGEATLGFSAPQ